MQNPVPGLGQSASRCVHRACHALVDPEGLKALRALEYMNPSWLGSLAFGARKNWHPPTAVRPVNDY
jgi:hypothetical protein